MTEIPERRLGYMPTQQADLARATKEKYDARQARYHATDRAKKIRAEYEANRKRPGDRHANRAPRMENRPFIVWDGEQPRDTGYSLFGNSNGDEICYPGLSTQDCLDLLIDTEIREPYAIHCVYGGDFDISWILNDLTWRQLGRLKNYGATQWKGYEIEHIPHKWWSVKYGKFRAKVFDVVSYFNSGLVVALEDWGIGPFADMPDVPDDVTMPTLAEMDNMSEPLIVATFKKLRGEFLWKDIQQQRRYMALELKYTKMMMEQLRDIFSQAGYLPLSWHGPGALSRMAATRHKVSTAMAISPRPVQNASRYAYFGGRFSPHLVGHMKRTIYVRDRNSAYPYAATFLPNLNRGKWRFENEPERIRACLDKFAVFHLTYHDKAPRPVGTPENHAWCRRTAWGMFPLPYRAPEHSGISYPYIVEGWYWSPEAKMVADSPNTTIHGVWVFDEDDPTDRPLQWMNEYYRRRLLLKSMGSPAEYTFKIIINGWYGQCAQRVGWDKIKKLPPKSHQLEWAGYITSHCRAAMWDMAQRVAPEDIISIDTDGITTLVPIPAKDGEIGDELGQWKDDVYEDGAFWQSGVFALKKGGKWIKTKTRGIRKGHYKPEDLVRLCDEGAKSFTVDTTRFIGYGLAYNGQFERKNTWVTEPQDYVFGGSGSTYHRGMDCKHVCHDGIHTLRNATRFITAQTYGDSGLYKSAPHFLPWEDNTPEMVLHMEQLDDDQTWYYVGSDDI